jgi:aminoglycoside/choline kinase family phosphotransferase
VIRPVGFMHRDFQSRNIMVRDGCFYLIDFQGGRLGPPHYDLASLLIDPYVDLPPDLREALLDYFAARLSALGSIPPAEIRHAYRYCALSRNLQILGAYGFLTRRKGKPFFARYIPAAVRSLQANLSHFSAEEFPNLARIAIETIPRYLRPSE